MALVNDPARRATGEAASSASTCAHTEAGTRTGASTETDACMFPIADAIISHDAQLARCSATSAADTGSSDPLRNDAMRSVTWNPPRSELLMIASTGSVAPKTGKVHRRPAITVVNRNLAPSRPRPAAPASPGVRGSGGSVPSRPAHP